MVGPIMLMKILHCKRVCQRSGQKENQSTSHEESDSVFIKSEKQEEEQKICRVCLKEGDVPIYGTKRHHIADALTTFGGINIQADDAYPKFLCDSCNTLLEGAILLRKTAQQSNELLMQSVKTQSTVTNSITLADEDEEMPNQLDEEDNTFDDDEEVIKMIENKHYSCKRCDLEFENFTEFSEHRLSVDHESKRLTCPICNKSYTALYYNKHLALHKQETPYMCDICGKKFIIQGQFTRHRLTHFYNLPFKCSLCPYRGRFSESLKMHMRSHTGEKPYQCSECAHRFVNKSNLSKHMLTHKGTHDYVCADALCGRGFYTKRDLDLHFKVDHTGIKDHVCNLCGKAFGYRKQMMKHQVKVHKREKLKSGRMPLYLVVEKKQQSGEEVVVTET